METTRNIIQLKNGLYIEDFEYSQGYFSYATCSDIFKARNIEERFVSWFKPRKNPYTGKIDLKDDMDLIDAKLLKVKMTLEVEKESKIG